jgi:hypothetical protein
LLSRTELAPLPLYRSECLVKAPIFNT